MERQDSTGSAGEAPSTPRLSSQRPLMMVTSSPRPARHKPVTTSQAQVVFSPPPVQEFHEEHHESLAKVGLRNGKDNLDEVKQLIKNIPTHTFAHFLALVYGSTMLSLATEMPPSWMISIIATISMGMFYYFKL